MTTPRKQTHTESSASVTDAKRLLRRELLAARRLRTTHNPDELQRSISAVALTMPLLVKARCVGLYASIPGEPGTEALRAALRQRGTRVLLPAVHHHDRRMDWALDEGTTVPAGPLSLPEPPGPRLGPAALQEAEVLIVPALAVDRAGHRLGRGGGYYDATLASVSTPLLALVHDEEVLEEVPTEPHDVPVQGALTPTRWFLF